ncbi:hypothetical protein BG262_01365 [Floricoccus penangensis]|uniref:PucR C-terminal helix-turn-helix domain-containing protein n=1 Tax=Floricoccus penangensis TaxID=1859475 RepID=A0A9Q5JH20_9LACT|nr:helix-turn-helix domain-containing protein [Floricoccus penangensis]OFI47009.1 hypothetical protein BG262_01365 [Floricoccus penangensis]
MITYEQFKKIFPQTMETSDEESKCLKLQLADSFAYLDINILSSRERELLTTIFPSKPIPDIFSNLPLGYYRILYFKADSINELSEILRSLVPDIFRQEKNIYLEEYTAENLSMSEYEEIFEAIKNDFGLDFTYYIGNFSQPKDLPDIYLKESEIFGKGYENIQDFAVTLLRNPLIENNLIMANLDFRLNQDGEVKEIISALYQSKANQNQAAKSLFIHRNTLLQKIKKIERKYGIKLDATGVVIYQALLNN